MSPVFVFHSSSDREYVLKKGRPAVEFSLHFFDIFTESYDRLSQRLGRARTECPVASNPSSQFSLVRVGIFGLLVNAHTEATPENMNRPSKTWNC